MPLIFRDTKGAPLTSQEVDNNFRELDTRITALEQDDFHAETLTSVTTEGEQLIIQGSHGSTFTLSMPARPFATKGMWQAHTAYEEHDLVQHGASLYRARQAHAGREIFDEKKWACVFSAPQNAAPKKTAVLATYAHTDMPAQGRVGEMACQVDAKGQLTPLFFDGQTWRPFH
ncbi:hypothetical protein EIL50_00515 [bacterium NHP-B]|nr:hypothetical protein EIL50_00515 [bacterium NHP-B]